MSALPKITALPKKAIALGAAALLALVGVALVANYIKQREETLTKKLMESVKQQQEKAVQVVVASTTDIPKDTTITETMVREVQIPRNSVAPGAVSSVSAVIGRKAAVDIPAREQIVSSQLIYKEMRTLATLTPAGKRAVTVYIDLTSSLAGRIRAGDYVDVITMVPTPGIEGGKEVTKFLTVPLFQNVLVLAIGAEMGKDQREAPGTVTLALPPKEAAMLTFISDQQGKIRLVLRSPLDTETEPMPPISWDTVMWYVMPQATFEQPREIEIIRGTQQGVIPVTSTKKAENTKTNEK